MPVWFHRLFLWLFKVRIIHVGRPPEQASLVLANHVSWVDIAVLGAVQPFSFIAKAEIESWPVFRHLARWQRTVFVDRDRRSHTANVNEQVAARLASGESIILFPEGTTGDGLRLLPFRSSLIGSVHKVSGDLLVQPLALFYSKRSGLPLLRHQRPHIAWYGDMDLAPHLMDFIKADPLDVTLIWCSPISTEQALSRKELAFMAAQQVKHALSEIKQHHAAK